MGKRLTRPATRLVQILLFALVVHLFVVPQIGGARNALDTVGSVRIDLLLLALVAEAACFAAYARMTQTLLPPAHRPPFGVALGSVMASTAVNHVVPGGAATTAAVNFRLLSRSGVPADDLRFAVGTQAIASAAVLNFILWGSLIISIPTGGYHRIYGTAAIFGVLLIGGFSLIVLGILRGRESFAGRVAALAGKVPMVDGDRVSVGLLTVAEQLRILASDRRRLRAVVAFASANWLLDAAALWIVLAALGARPPVVGVVVAYSLANVLGAIPISPGGLGVIEAVLIPTLVGFGTPLGIASLGVVAYRLINFWLPIPVGAATYGLLQFRAGRNVKHGFMNEINVQTERQVGST